MTKSMMMMLEGGGGMDRDKKLNVMIVQNNFQPVKLLH